LSQAQIDTIVDWVDAAMPKGDPETAKEGVPREVGNVQRVDFTLAPSEAYQPQPGVLSDYRCFGIPWPLTERAYVRGLFFEPGHPELVHHVVAYKLDGEVAELVAEAEAIDDAPGYDCPGGPQVVQWGHAPWLASWEPGASQGLFPNGIGIAVEPDTIVVLQVHYTPLGDGRGPDLTTVDVQVETDVERVGKFTPLADVSWVYAGTMEIPPQSEDVEHSTEISMDQETLIHSVNLHMHKLGQTTQLSIVNEAGDEDCLLDIDEWDYDWQRFYTLKSPRTLGLSDKIRFSCTWDNPTDQAVFWGDATEDEMCLAKLFTSQH
jgi:hypothetical protein